MSTSESVFSAQLVAMTNLPAVLFDEPANVDVIVSVNAESNRKTFPLEEFKIDIASLRVR
jgi:hypothetical protein